MRAAVALALAALSACSALAPAADVAGAAAGEVGPDGAAAVDGAGGAADADAAARPASDSAGAAGAGDAATIDAGATADASDDVPAADAEGVTDAGDAASDAADVVSDVVSDTASDAAGTDAEIAEPPCQSALVSVADMPLTSAKVDFEACTGCVCCLPGGAYPAEMNPACLTCGPAGALQAAGVTLVGGQLTTMVGCVQGNAAAPMANVAMFVGGAFVTPSGAAGLQLTLQPAATMFGFSAVPTSSDAKPVVILRGYDDAGVLVAQDAFDFASAPGGSCATLNPAVQFFGFRPCFGGLLRKVVVEVSDANVAIDEVRVYGP